MAEPTEGWTDERVAILERMHEKGHSYRAIAKELGGVSRNAVCGKIHRLGLARPLVKVRAIQRANASAKRTLLNDTRAAKAAARALAKGQPKVQAYPEVKHTFVAVVSEAPRPWAERAPRQCAYPVDGSGADTLSCCNPTDGRAYCAGHYRMMYRDTKPLSETLFKTKSKHKATLTRAIDDLLGSLEKAA